MAIPKIKATYSLDVETVALLERLARRWETSKSEALRRLIREGAATATDKPEHKVAALQRAQQSIELTDASAKGWMSEVREMRRAWSRHRGS